MKPAPDPCPACGKRVAPVELRLRRSPRVLAIVTRCPSCATVRAPERLVVRRIEQPPFGPEDCTS